MITVYSKPGCQPCKMTYTVLDKAGLAYESVDIVEVPEAAIFITEELGYKQAPVVVVDEHDHWSGFRPDHIARIAAQQQAAQ